MQTTRKTTRLVTHRLVGHSRNPSPPSSALARGLDLSCFFEGSTKPSAADPREAGRAFSVACVETAGICIGVGAYGGMRGHGAEVREVREFYLEWKKVTHSLAE